MKSLLLAFAMFSRLPVPRVEFRPENMGGVLAALPLVGLVVGLCVLAWHHVALWLDVGPFGRGVGMALLPLLLTGGIHMDGLCDTADAMASHGDAATRQRILRDPHCGAFAVMAVWAYLSLFAALAAKALPWPLLCCFGLCFVLSRVLTALAVLLLPGAPDSSLARHFQEAACRKITLWQLGLWLAALAIALPLLGGLGGFLALLLPLALFWRWKKLAAEFGGMSGDLGGCLLQLCELASLAALVLTPNILFVF